MKQCESLSRPVTCGTVLLKKVHLRPQRMKTHDDNTVLSFPPTKLNRPSVHDDSPNIAECCHLNLLPTWQLWHTFVNSLYTHIFTWISTYTSNFFPRIVTRFRRRYNTNFHIEIRKRYNTKAHIKTRIKANALVITHRGICFWVFKKSEESKRGMKRRNDIDKLNQRR